MQPRFPSTLRARILLPASKSISNRVLVMNALCSRKTVLRNLADCDDTRVLAAALSRLPETVDIGAAGTAMRFGTAYFAVTPGSRVITGSERMRQRPIGVLVDALRKLGADIRYEAEEGFPPLRVSGRTLCGGEVELSGSVSSQYISALLMIAPVMANGLTLRLEGDIISRPYIDMTLALMRQMGSEAQWADSRTLRVEGTGYRGVDEYIVESDWSAASYWYEMVALSPDSEACILLPHLHRESLQGDARVQHFFEELGVSTEFTERGVMLTKSGVDHRGPLELDLLRQPDLAQTLTVACAMLRRPFRFTGVRSLRIKETDRIAALQTELAKFGIRLEAEGDSALFVSSYPDSVPRILPDTAIDTYHDHRMAMAFAPCALVVPGFTINDPEVVTKSYPGYWRDLERIV